MSRKSGPFNTPDTEPAGDWRNRANCLKSDPELFFPTGETRVNSPGYQQAKLAKEVCARCVVVDDCLSYALQTNENFGIWGGMTENERRALKRQAIRQRRLADIATSESGGIL